MSHNSERPWMDKVRRGLELVEEAVNDCANVCRSDDLPEEMQLIGSAVQAQAEMIDRTSEGETCDEQEDDRETALTFTGASEVLKG